MTTSSLSYILNCQRLQRNEIAAHLGCYSCIYLAEIDLLNYSYSENIIIQENDNAISATINIEDSESGINGIIFITQWDESFSTFAGNENVTADFRHVEQITVNGLDIIVVGNDDDKVSIRYLDRNTDYSITLIECDFETAVEIANSLK